jgi:cysteine desulfurase
MIYFDNSATAPIDAEVYEAMLPYLREEYGNPSSKYYCKAVNAKAAVESARENVAKLIGANPEEIVFTAGATESTNFIIKGYLDYRKYYGDGRNHVITSLVEHKATLNTCKFLNGEIYSNNDPTTSLFGEKKRVDRGFEASFVGVDSTGAVIIDNVERSVKDNTAMISVIYVNNEVGTINDVKKIAEIAHRNKVAFHTDITQALGKIPIDVRDLDCDYLSCSAHKIYGPKGIGAAYLKSDKYGIEPISAFVHGGEQEQGFRAGTLAVHDIVGFGKAAEIALKNMKKEEKRLSEMDQYLVESLSKINDIALTNSSDNRMKGIISIIVNRDNFNNERYIKKVCDDVALSTGSACSAGEPSYVIDAMGLRDKVSQVVRITVNKYTTEKEVDDLVTLLKQA